MYVWYCRYFVWAYYTCNLDQNKIIWAECDHVPVSSDVKLKTVVTNIKIRNYGTVSPCLSRQCCLLTVSPCQSRQCCLLTASPCQSCQCCLLTWSPCQARQCYLKANFYQRETVWRKLSIIIILTNRGGYVLESSWPPQMLYFCYHFQVYSSTPRYIIANMLLERNLLYSNTALCPNWIVYFYR